MVKLTCDISKMQRKFDQTLKTIATRTPEGKRAEQIAELAIPAIWASLGFDIQLSHLEKTDQGGTAKFPCALDPENPQKCVATAVGLNYDPYGKRGAPDWTASALDKKRRQLSRNMQLSGAKVGFLVATTRNWGTSIHVCKNDAEGVCRYAAQIPVSALSVESARNICKLLGVKERKHYGNAIWRDLHDHIAEECDQSEVIYTVGTDPDGLIWSEPMSKGVACWWEPIQNEMFATECRAIVAEGVSEGGRDILRAGVVTKFAVPRREVRTRTFEENYERIKDKSAQCAMDGQTFLNALHPS